jgi:hypothetical protein
MTSKPWQKYGVGNPSKKANWTEPNCCPFDDVFHVTHISTALSILREETIRPQLVYDESILNTRRILVNWVSPNHWAPGFRYGNVSFDLSWRHLIEDKQFYWVEVMDYQPKACRLLVSDIDYTSDPQLRRYRPTDGDGPWWWDRSADMHYRNGHICLEVMLEFEVSREYWKGISFVKHHLLLHRCLILSRSRTWGARSKCTFFGRNNRRRHRSR